jgi:hypothetical protein
MSSSARRGLVHFTFGSSFVAGEGSGGLDLSCGPDLVKAALP